MEVRRRSVMLGKKGSGFEQILDLPPFNPNLEK